MKSFRILCVAAFLLHFPGVQVRAAKFTAGELLDPNHIVRVEIDIPADQWQKLCAQTRDFRTAFTNPIAKPYSYFEATVKIDGVEIQKVGVRKKGFIGSLDSERPSLKISFDKYQEQSPVDGIETLTLNNNKQDRALVSQSLTYNLFRDAGVHAPRCNFATVTVNGKYLGIYSHVESIKEPYLINEFGDGSGRLYEGTLADFYPKAVERLEAKNQAAKNLDKAMKLAELLAAEEPLDLEQVEKLVDVDNFLKFWAIESIINFWDGYSQNQNNYFAYENPANGKFYFMPWGADSCFGSGRGFGRFRGNRSSVVSADSMLANRLFNTPGIPERYRKSLEWILEEVWDSEELIAETERIFTMLKDEFDSQQFDAKSAIKPTRDFIRNRKQTILAELENDWPIEVSERPRRPMYQVPMGEIIGTFSSKWREKKSSSETSLITFQGEAITSPSKTVTVQEEPQFRFGRFGPPNPNPKINVVLVYARPNRPDMTLTLAVSRNDFVANPAGKVTVMGSFTAGDERRGGFRGMGKAVSGTLTLSQAGTEKGDLVVGEFSVKLLELRGGFMDRGR